MTCRYGAHKAQFQKVSIGGHHIESRIRIRRPWVACEQLHRQMVQLMAHATSLLHGALLWFAARVRSRTGLALLYLVCGVAAASSNRLVTLADLVRFSGAGTQINLDISPDGRHIAIEHHTHIRALEANARGRIRELGEGLLPIWSPLGDQLAFYSARSGELQLWSWHARTGKARQLTQFASGIDPDPNVQTSGSTDGFMRYSWSPDGSRIVFASRIAQSRESKAALAPTPHDPQPTLRERAPLVLSNLTPPADTLLGVFAQAESSAGIAEVRNGRTHGYRPRRRDEALTSQLFIVDVHSGDLMQLTHDAQSVFHPDWSPDGRFIACASGPAHEATEGEQRFPPTGGSILSIDSKTGRKTILASGAGFQHQPRWSRDGDLISYFSSSGPYDRFLPTIHVRDVRTGALFGSGPHIDRRLIRYSWSHVHEDLLFSYHDGLHSRLARTRPASDRLTPITPLAEAPATIEAWAEARDGSIAWVQEDAQNLLRVFRLVPNSRQPKLLLRLDPEAEELSRGPVSTVKWKNDRGEALEGALLLPPNGARRSPYPLIVDAYPLTGATRWFFPLNGNQAWASMGYAVFKPGPRAPSVWLSGMRSGSHALAGKGPEGWKVTEDDVLSGVDYLIEHGIADPERMCLYGFSNGGGVVSHLVTKTNRFKCAVVVAPALADWVRPALLKTGGGSIEMFTGGQTLDEGLADYIALSPVFRLSSVRTPMLIAAGDRDGDFLLNAIEIYNGVRRTGTEVTLIRYPDQGHVLKGAALEDFWSRQMTFFRRHLGSTILISNHRP